MIAFISTIFRAIANFMASPIKGRIFFIVVIALIALIDFLSLGLARRTFVFYNADNGLIAVEDRMLAHSCTRENDIIRYTEETLLGPVSPDLLPLFPRGTKLNTLMFRNGIVYVDFSENAALPPIEGGKTLDNFRVFYDGILRNFSYVKDVRFFIEGNSAFSAGFEVNDDAWFYLPDGENFPEI